MPLLRCVSASGSIAVMLSHRDSDHIGGAPPCWPCSRRRELLSSIEAGHRAAGAAPAPRHRGARRRPALGLGRRELRGAAPRRGRLRGGRNKTQCHELRAAHPRTERRAALLVGDIEQAAGGACWWPGRRPHQSQRDSWCPTTAARPPSSAFFWMPCSRTWALVQAGYRSRFGHPAPLGTGALPGARNPRGGLGTLRCRDLGVRATRMRSACQREAGLRYWHHRVP